MRWIAAACLAWASMALASDVCLRVAQGQFGHDQDGSAMLAAATRLNPLSLNARFEQAETLFQSWRVDQDARNLREATLIACGILHDFPGNAQALEACAMAVSLEATHTDQPFMDSARTLAARSLEADPIAVAMIERAMFNLAVSRQDRPQFIRLGIRRMGLTAAPLKMKCSLCGRGWLEHGRR